jgi:acylphosphatase
MKRLSIKIYGRVQGVGFRYAAYEGMKRLGLEGLRRNELDGSVYIEAEGDEAALKEFLAWCHKGPELAKVERVEEEWNGD